MNSSYLEIQTSTWKRDTHSLFDYETKEIQKANFRATGPCCVYRMNTECYIPDTEILDGSVPLLRIDQKSSDYQASLISDDIDDKMWLVVKGMKTSSGQGCKLKVGDWLKMGRVGLRVLKINTNVEKLSLSSLPDFFQNSESEEIEVKAESNNPEDSKEGAPCRICLTEHGTVDNPLISPCKCAGTMKFVHLSCLKEWIKSKVASRVTERGMSLYHKDLCCELCNTSLPAAINLQGHPVSLVNVTYPTKIYIMLEELRPERNQKHGLHFISLEEGQWASIGRGHDCDIKITDISVSRKHSKIRLTNNEFYIEDSKSKFGTLLMMSNSFIIRNKTDVTVQINRTVFHIMHKHPWRCSDICGCILKAKVGVEASFNTTQPDPQANEALSNRATMYPAIQPAVLNNYIEDH